MPPAFRGIERWSAPKGEWWSTNARHRGRWLMFGDTRRATVVMDLDQWPPQAVAHRDEFVASFDALPDGRFAVCSMLTQPPGEYAVRIHPQWWANDPATGSVNDPAGGTTTVHALPNGLAAVDVWAISGRVVAFDTLIQRDNPSGHHAYLLEGGAFVEAPGLPPVTMFSTHGHQTHANGKVVLASGKDVLLWDGHGYEWTGTAFERQWELGAGEPELGGQMGVPWGHDSFFFLSNRCVMHTRRGRRSVRVHPEAESVMSLSPGPQGSVILCHGQNPKGFVARIWFPEEGTYIPILRGHLGWNRSGASPELYWSAKTEHTHFTPLHTFPDSDLLELKRVKPRGAGYLVRKEDSSHPA